MSSRLDSVLRDLRLGARQLVRRPGFLAASMFTLALGVGANTTMFSVVYGVLLKPLPFDQPERLVSIWSAAPGIGWNRAVLAAAQYFTYREENRTFEDVAVWQAVQGTLTGDGEPERIETLQVTDGFLPVLRVTPMLGRRFTRADDAPGAPRRAMITFGFWQTRFGGRRDIVGRPLTLNGTVFEVIGVLPRSFRFLEASPAVLVPLAFDRAATTIMNFSYLGIARLKPGATVEQANRDVARMIALTPQKFAPAPVLGPTWFADARMGPDVHPLSEDAAGNIGGTLWMLMGTIGLVLLIACANVANLFLVRADARQRELAVRAALGAGRWTIARALLSESVTLGIAGGTLGIALAWAAIRVIKANAPRALPRTADIALDPIVLAFAAVLSVAAGFLLGLVPVFRFASPRLAALGDGGRSASDGRSRHRTRSALVAIEIALALVLLVASGLMVRTFVALQRVDPGFVRGAEIMTVELSIPRTLSSNPEATMRRHDEILRRLEQIPGVSSVGVSSSVTMDGQGMSNPLLVEEFPVPEGQSVQSRRMKWISPGYFETMGTRLVAGRRLAWADIYGYSPVLMVNERLAAQYWKRPADAIGKRVRETAAGPWRQIIGVVADERQDGPSRPALAIMYWPCLVKTFFAGPPFAPRSLTYVIRSPRAGTEGFVDDIRRAVRALDRNLPLARLRTVEQIAAESMAQTSFALVMLAIAAAVSLLLGVVGIYGVVSYVAAQRTREVGIRVALGARPRDVTGLFVRHGLVAAGLGIGVGAAGAAALSSLMSSMLFGVKGTDPATYAAVSAGLAAVTILATYLPARRAARMDPVTALRSDG
jgi:putative ABC transport system permease protein